MVNIKHYDSEPAALLRQHASLFIQELPSAPILDLACGNGRNGIYLATLGVPVVLCDISEAALSRAKASAAIQGVTPKFMVLDLEKEGHAPLEANAYGGILVFRYLYRPLMPVIKQAIRSGGVLIYETFTVDQVRYGKPTNPDFLLQPGELQQRFADWEVLHYFEGIQPDPERAVAQIVCRKP
ncbi:MAG: methyltransferase domain-containing protein [Syntrophaceae bacterium]|nr:methyltransferase domain-containing protein [Syntrophaceae bacterium]